MVINNSMLKVSSSTTIMIYGAGAKGFLTKELLKANGLSVAAFIDRNASCLRNNEGIQIFPIDAEQISCFDMENTLLIISTQNVFAHDEIVEELKKIGIKYYICLSHILNPGKNDVIINKIFEALYNEKELKIGTLIPEPDVIEATVKPDIYFESKEYVKAYIPVEFLFSPEAPIVSMLNVGHENIVKRYCGKNAAYFSENRGLYEVFGGKAGIDDWRAVKTFKKELKRITSNTEYASKEDEERDFQRHLADRYYVYDQMQKAYTRQTGFFKENPSIVYWDTDKKYFIVDDGNNRIAFLLSKGILDIPCKIKKIDYEAYSDWISTSCSQNQGFRALYMNIFDYLGKKDIPISSDNGVLIRGDFKEYLTEQFERSGAKIVHEENENLGIAVVQLQNEETVANLPRAKYLFGVIESENVLLYDALQRKNLTYGLVGTFFRESVLLDIVLFINV